MRYLILLFTVFCFTLSSCEIDLESVSPADLPTPYVSGTSQEEDAQNLQDLLMILQGIASSHTCNDPNNWGFTPYGSRACGGPIGYVAYPLSIEQAFLQKVEEYTSAQYYYNQIYSIVSICIVPNPPTGVVCTDGEAVLVY